MASAAVVPKMRDVRRRLWALRDRRKAAPGPSGWRNSYLVYFAEVEGGVMQMRLWTELWSRGRIDDDVI
eukprot:8731364-Karenia_brevis.AAC.1